MKDEDTENPDNVIPFPKPAPIALLGGEISCGGWKTTPDAPSDTPKITACAPLGRTYDLNDPEDFSAYMAAEMYVAIKIQGLFGVEEANEWVKHHRGLDQEDEAAEPKGGDE